MSDTVALDPTQLNATDEELLDALADGRHTPGSLVEETGKARTYIQGRLKRLVEHGHVERVSMGLYELVDDPRADADGEPEVRTDGGSKYRDGYRSPDFREKNREALDMAAQRRRTRLVNGDRLGRGL